MYGVKLHVQYYQFSNNSKITKTKAFLSAIILLRLLINTESQVTTRNGVRISQRCAVRILLVDYMQKK